MDWIQTIPVIVSASCYWFQSFPMEVDFACQPHLLNAFGWLEIKTLRGPLPNNLHQVLLIILGQKLLLNSQFEMESLCTICQYVSCSLFRNMFPVLYFGRRLLSKTLRRVRNRIQLGSRFITPFARKRNAREQVGVKAVTKAEEPFQRSRWFFSPQFWILLICN